MAEQNEDFIARMSFGEIAAYIGRLDDGLAAAHGGALTRRLYEIALLDNHVPQNDRDEARRLLVILKGTMEIRYRDSPKALKLYREANAFMEDNARRVGVGSLFWQIGEREQMSDAEIVSFATLPEHRAQLPDFIALVAPDFPDLAEQLTDEMNRLARSVTG